LAVCVPDSFAFAKARKFLTSSFDHAKATRFFRFAMNTALKKARIIALSTPAVKR
jgi:hypothetical protein